MGKGPSAVAHSGPGEATLAPTLGHMSASLTQRHHLHTLLASAGSGRTSRARSPPGPSAAAGPPSARSRKTPTAPGGPRGLGGGASAGDRGWPRIGPPDAPCARPPPPRRWQRPQQPGVRDRAACPPARPRGCRRPTARSSPRATHHASPGRELQNILRQA